MTPPRDRGAVKGTGVQFGYRQVSAVPRGLHCTQASHAHACTDNKIGAVLIRARPKCVCVSARARCNRTPAGSNFAARARRVARYLRSQSESSQQRTPRFYDSTMIDYPRGRRRQENGINDEGSKLMVTADCVFNPFT